LREGRVGEETPRSKERIRCAKKKNNSGNYLYKKEGEAVKVHQKEDGGGEVGPSGRWKAPSLIRVKVPRPGKLH